MRTKKLPQAGASAMGCELDSGIADRARPRSSARAARPAMLRDRIGAAARCVREGKLFVDELRAMVPAAMKQCTAAEVGNGKPASRRRRN
jgi:hypothetical protein